MGIQLKIVVVTEVPKSEALFDGLKAGSWPSLPVAIVVDYPVCSLPKGGCTHFQFLVSERPEGVRPY